MYIVLLYNFILNIQSIIDDKYMYGIMQLYVYTAKTQIVVAMNNNFNLHIKTSCKFQCFYLVEV